MKAERFRQIRNVFDAAMEREPDARTAFLKAACQGDEELLVEVGRLLIAHGQPTAWIDEEVLGARVTRLEGRRVGPYEILRQLGEGGMGVVYLAARADGAFQKQVALKIVHGRFPGDAALIRFQRERDILASLDHPSVARILDGGSTDDGLPYLVMEYVEGQPIDAYCDAQRLEVAERLRLFREVCTAVQYAHHNHVVHRDIKPANVFVTPDGAVKLLDFGIARLVRSGPDGPTLTQSDLLAMTPEYASPEQVNGAAITPAADVYSLGILLYELLTGRRPYRLKSRIFREIARVICEEPPTRPSAVVGKNDAEDAAPTPDAVSRARSAAPGELKRQLKGDLDSILLKALEKDPIRRYRSAGDFSDDLRRHLDHVAVAARPAWTRAAVSLIERNRWWLLGASALGLAAWNRIIVVAPPLVILAGAWVVTLAFVVLAMRWSRGRWARPRHVAVIGKLTAVWLLAIWLAPDSGWDALGVVTFVCLCFLGLRWPARGRQLGPVLVDASVARRIRRFLEISFSCMWLLAIYEWLFSTRRIVEDPYEILWAASLAIFAFLAGRQEIRQRGLAATGFLIPWRDVLSFSWEPDPERCDVLRIRAKGPGGFWGLWPVRMRVRPEDRPNVQALLERQLFQWPDRT